MHVATTIDESVKTFSNLCFGENKKKNNFLSCEM